MNTIKKMLSFVLFVLVGHVVQAASDEANYLSIAPFYIEPGEVVDIDLNRINSEKICAYQTDLILPKGLSVTEDEDGYLDIYGSTRSKKHVLESSVKKDGSILILCYSNRNSVFTGNSGAVATISLIADGSMQAGVYEVKLKNTEVTYDYLELYNPKEYTSSAIVGVVSEDCLTLAGAYNEETVAILNEKIVSKSGINVIDMKGVTAFDGKVDVTNNPNTLIYTSSEIGLENDKNVIVNGTCDNLVLEDGYPFAPIAEFSIIEGAYNRTLSTGKYGTVVLPFNIDDATKAAYEFYTLEGMNGSSLQFNLEEQPKAGIPYLYINKGESVATGFIAMSGSKSAMLLGAVVSDGWQMKATYSPIKITDATLLDKTYYISNNKVMNATSSLAISPFRAYIEGPSFSEVFNSSVNAIGIRLEGTTNIIPLENVDGGDGLYDLFGRRIDIPKGIYVVGGKKYYKH